MARTDHAYTKSTDNAIFAEFQWANFFRTHLTIPQLLDRKTDLEAVTLAQLKSDDPDFAEEMRSEVNALARSPLASGLPGWRG